MSPEDWGMLYAHLLHPNSKYNLKQWYLRYLQEWLVFRFAGDLDISCAFYRMIESIYGEQEARDLRHNWELYDQCLDEEQDRDDITMDQYHKYMDQLFDELMDLHK